MVVIYAEKASLAKEIANALGAGRRTALKNEPTVGYYEFNFNGERAFLCHGVGHLAQLVPAKSYDEKFAKWDLNVFPCIPEKFRTAPKAKTIACLKLVKSLFDKADWIVNATDADREGELIFSYVYEVCRCNKPYKRVWIEDLTDQKIRYAFNNLKNPNERLSAQFEGNASNLQLAARARDISDWLIGTNLTVAFTKKFGGYGNLLSLGRVQTPTLALVVEREKAIKNHVKTPFWKLSAVFSQQGISFSAEYINGNFTNENMAKAVLNECKGKNGIVEKIDKKHKTQSQPLLYNTTGLQIATNKLFDWDSDKTSAVMQSLYEKKFMSYPRTSSEHLTVEMQGEVATTLKKIFALNEYSKFAVSDFKFTSRHFDNQKVGSHTAVISTTNVPQSLDELSEDEKMLYDLLVKSLIRTVYPKAEFDETTVTISVGEHKFSAVGKIIVKNGWYDVDAYPKNIKSLPTLSQGQELKAEFDLKKGETEPPKRFTQASLLETMELAGQKLEDEQARTLMKLQKKGLGTDATRSAILKALFQKGYLTQKGKTVYPTEKGIYIIDTLPINSLKSAEMTGNMEKALNDISLGKCDYNAFIAQIKQLTKDWFNTIASSNSAEYIDEQKLICPICGKRVGSYNWGYGCTGYKDGCKFSVGKTIAGKNITETQVVKLCESGSTGLIKGFKSKSGKDFDAYLVLDKAKGEVGFKFENKKG